MRFKYKWLSENDNGAGGGTSGTPAPQATSGTDGQGQPDPRIQQLSNENATWRNKHKTAEQERDSWKQKHTEATGQLTAYQQQAALERDLIIAAANAGLNDVRDALRFIDLTKLDAAEDKRAQSITDALKALTESKPYLVKAGPTVQPPPPPPPSPGNPAGTTGLTLAQITAMSDEDFAKHKDDILKFTATHRG